MKQIILFTFIFAYYLVLGQKKNSTFDISGRYTHKTGYCIINLEIYPKRDKYEYYLKTSEREAQGKIEIRELAEDKKGYYFVLKGLNWNDCTGIIENGAENNEEKQKCPDVEGIFYPSGIIIQNSGNSMNYYVKIEECDDKYIQLTKQ